MRERHDLTLERPKLDAKEQHFRIPSPVDELSLFLRYLPAEGLPTAATRIALYVHGATFPSALSVAHRFIASSMAAGSVMPCWMRSAANPDTCGVAIDVPWK